MSSSLRAVGRRLVWLIGVVVHLPCCTTGPIVHYCGHNMPWYYQLMPITCHFQDCKALMVFNLIICKQHYSTLPLSLSDI